MNPSHFTYPIKRIGLIGGGQLGKMTAQAAKKMGFVINVLDPNPRCPTSSLADVHITGSLYDAAKLKALAQISDILTYDVEHVNTEVLIELEQAHYPIHPSPQLLALIQDKFKQKQALLAHQIPTARFQALSELTLESLTDFTFPMVQKTREGGYDGKGVMILRGPEDFNQALPPPFFVEEFVEFTKELAVMVARTSSGEMACYPVVEMIFDEATNICDIVAVPAQIDSALTKRAQELALQVVESLKGVGVFGIEMFLTTQGDILVNEIAPRPHNSGHYTLEACVTSQFEQLIRILSDLPLGSVELVRPAVMWNLLGAPDQHGWPVIEGLHEALAIEGLSFHFYGKEQLQPSRKMGHLTIVDRELNSAVKKLQQIKSQLKITAQHPPQETVLKLPLVGIIMGSDSDLPILKEAAQLLDDFHIPYELTLVSAHRTPHRLFDYASTAEKRGLEVIIAGAGGAAHLPGMVASLTALPVIGVPVKTSSLQGLDSLLSIVQMPAGIPVATVAINNAKNAALLAAQILGVKHPDIRQQFKEHTAKTTQTVLEKAERLEKLGYAHFS